MNRTVTGFQRRQRARVRSAALSHTRIATADSTATAAAAAVAAAATDHRSRKKRGVTNISTRCVFVLCPHPRSVGAFVAGDRLNTWST